MDRRKFSPSDKLGRPTHQSGSYQPRTWCGKIRNTFKIDAGDFPSLSSSNENKRSAQATLSYSDKLKAHQELSFQVTSPPKPEHESSKPQSSKVKNGTPPINNCLIEEAQTRKVAAPKLIKSIDSKHYLHDNILTPNKQTESNKSVSNPLAPKKIESQNHSHTFKANLHVPEKISLPKQQDTNLKVPKATEKTEIPDDEGWTVCQKKNRLQAKDSNNSEDCLRNCSRNREKTSKYREPDKLFSSKNKHNFSKPCDHPESKYEAKNTSTDTGKISNKNYKSKLNMPSKESNFSNLQTGAKNIPIKPPLNATSHAPSGFAGGFQNHSKQPQKRMITDGSGNNNKVNTTVPGAVGTIKKKKKSKGKRLAALQSNKLLIITPEAHTRILSRTSGLDVKSQENVIVNLTDNEEYPELGIKAISIKKKGAVCDVDFKIDLQAMSEDHQLKSERVETSHLPSSVLQDVLNDKDSGEKVIKTKEVTEEAKLPIHSNEAITVSLFEMIKTGKPKKKEPEVNIQDDTRPETLPVKQKTLKSTVQPVNASSSKLVTKRGKERENPKAKKPTKLRKLILMERELKKARMLQMSPNNNCVNFNGNEKSDVDNGYMSDICGLSPDIKEGISKALFCPSINDNSIANDITNISTSSTNSDKEIFSEENKPSFDLPVLSPQSKNNKQSCSLSSNSSKNSPALTKPFRNTDLCKDFEVLKKTTDNNFYKISQNDVRSKKVNQTIINFYQNYKDSENRTVVMESDLTKECLSTILEDSILDAYVNNLVQMIVFDCMSDIRLWMVNSETSTFARITKTSSGNSQDIILNYCDSLAHSILEETVSVRKSSTNKIHFNFDTKSAATDGVNSLLNDYLQKKDTFEKFLLTLDLENIQEFIPNKFYTNNKPIVNEVEKISSTKNECDLNVSFSRHLEMNENNDIVIEPGPLQVKHTEKERLEAVKILLHTRKFRSYCTHFTTKEIDETVFSLIDDLARFQDRLHQKDPVKAHMKKRLMYGIKEIKKHMKLKKLKGIIIATDIEDNKAEGGLNDLLKEVFSLAEAYHIPYVFSHKRYNMGKVCRKPAPVSCVGIINYEGSEKNFKKILELQEETKCDYDTLTKKLMQELEDKHIQSLLETVQKSIAPYEINKKILKDIFDSNTSQDEKTSLNQSSIHSETGFSSRNDSVHLLSNNTKLVVNESENVIKADLGKNKICALLTKYSLVKS